MTGSQRRGARGGKRAIRVHVDHRNDPERVAARAAAAAHQAALDKRIAAEEAAAADAAAARRAAERAAADAAARAMRAETARRKSQWNLGQARALIRQGYSVEQAMHLTGWEREWLT